jgi:hypothetical protein
MLLTASASLLDAVSCYAHPLVETTPSTAASVRSLELRDNELIMPSFLDGTPAGELAASEGSAHF